MGERRCAKHWQSMRPREPMACGCVTWYCTVCGWQTTVYGARCVDANAEPLFPLVDKIKERGNG